MKSGRKVVVVGATACGPKTACRLKRILPSAEITVLEKGQDISYGACGMPYFIAGAPERIDALAETPIGVKRTPGFFQKVKGVEVRTGVEVLAIDRERRELEVRELAAGTTDRVPYDKLVLATGGLPVRPPLPGIDAEGVQCFHDLRDAAKLDELLAENPIERAVVVGAGLIGIEMAEALTRRGVEVTLVEKLDWILPTQLDEALGHLAGKHLVAKGVKLVCGAAVERFAADESGRLTAVEAGGESYPAQLAVLGIGVRANDRLAEAAGLAVDPRGGIAVDRHGRTSDPEIYAGGDCVISPSAHPAMEESCYAPQGSTANKQGRVIADHIAGLTVPFPGVLRTSICRAFDFTLARTGFGETEARERGFEVETAICASPDRPHFMGTAAPITIKLVVERATRRLLGGQIVGPGDAARRIDVLATAITLDATLDQLAHLDLAYAPPYSPPIDPLLTAAHVLQNKLDGVARGVSPVEALRKLQSGEALAVDVRSPEEYEEVRLPFEVVHIPLGALREKGSSLPTDRELLAFCKVSLRGYEAQRILEGLGYDKVSFIEGGIVGWPYLLDTGS